MRRFLLVAVLLALAGAGLWFLRSIRAPVEGTYLDRDFRYDDTVPLRDAWNAFLQMRFETLDGYLARMVRIEREGSRQSPFLAFLSIAGRPEHFDRISLWTEHRPRSPYAWLCLADSYNGVAFEFVRNLPIADLKRNPSAPFLENQLKSEECLRRSSDLDPLLAYPVARRIGVDMVLGRDRRTMERHYAEALRITPFCLMTYLLKADYLKPGWYGTWDEYQTYVLDTIRRFPPNTLIPIALAMNYNNEYAALNDPGYLQRPDVWREVSGMFQAYLAENPSHDGVRSLYFRLLCERQDERSANEQARVLKDAWGPLWILGGWNSESAFKEIVARRLARSGE
jgi:hypothetical protein